jgi:4-amino-4-deoxy-L-arabinose transferase-like glycosyltransferase
MTTDDTRAASARTTLWLALIVLAGIALRLWLVSASPLDPRFSDADDGDYYRRALRLAVSGVYLDDSWLIRPPGHIVFFAIWLQLAMALGMPHHGVLFVQLAQIAVSAGTILLAFAIARQLAGRRRAGLLAAGFVALWFPYIEMTTVLFTEASYLTLFLLHIWCLLRFDQSGRWRDLIAAGLALGAAALTRSPALYAIALVIGWLVLRARGRGLPWQQVVRQALVVACACLAVVGPWTVRNAVVYQRLIPVDTLGQINLWLDLDANENRNTHIATLRGMPQADRAAYALARARDILAADPTRLFHKSWPMFQHVWKAQYIEDLYVRQSFHARPLREAAWIGVPGDVLWLVVVLAGALALASPAREGWHTRLYILAWLAYSLLTVIIFHVEPRYLLPVWALFGLMAAGAPWALERASWRGAWLVPRLIVVGALLGLVFSYRDYPALIERGVRRELAVADAQRAAADGDLARAEQAWRAASRAHPESAEAREGLALTLMAQGRDADAAAALLRGSSRRTELIGALLERPERDPARLAYLEATAGEDVQRWTLAHLPAVATTVVRLGSAADLGYIAGFAPAEQDQRGPFRWLGATGRVALPLPEPLAAGSTLVIRATGGRPGITPLTVLFSDGTSVRVPVSGGVWRSYRLAVPAALTGVTVVDLWLSAPIFVPAQELPGSDDSRSLSLMIDEVRVQ